MRHKYVETKALLDCGASEVFIDKEFVRKRNIPTIKLKKPKNVYNADGSRNKEGKITHVVKTEIKIGENSQPEILWVTELGDEDFILGLTWLKRHNPKINWETGKMTIKDQKTYIRSKSTKSQAIAEAELSLEPEETFEDKFPERFNEFKPLFSDQKAQRFPDERSCDHAIELIEGWTPINSKVYTLPPEEDKALKEWIDENLKLGYI